MTDDGVTTQPSHAMGRARMPRSERRAQLLRAAQEVFTAAGYHQAAMDDIAEQAGVSKPVLYQHFPGKLELYLALLDNHIDDLVKVIGEAFISSSDNRSRLYAAVVAYFDWVASGDGGYRLIFESDLRNDPQVYARIERAQDACTHLIARTLVHDTGLDPARSRMLALSLVGISISMASAWLNVQDEINRDEAIETMMNLLWRGMSGLPASSRTNGNERTDTPDRPAQSDRQDGAGRPDTTDRPEATETAVR